MSTLQESLITLISEQLAIKPEKIELDANFKAIGADSLDIVEIAMAIEDEYQIEIPDDAAERIETIRDMLTVLEPLIK